MVFYAWTYKRDDSGYAQFMIVAPSVEYVDEWYRWTKEDGHKLERHSPELYGYDWAHYPWVKVEGSGKASKLRNKIMFKKAHQRDDAYHYTFSGQFAPDHRSGHIYYIRSKSNPQIFWSEDGGTIYSTKHSRTKFRVTIRGSPDEVIIPDDDIYISALVGESLQEYTVQIGQDDGALRIDAPQAGGTGLVRKNHRFAHGVADFKFSDFKKSFHPVGNESEPADAKVMFLNEGGDEWELVK